MKKIILGFVLLFLLLASKQAFAQTTTIDPRVLEDTANGATAHFLVILRAQAQARVLAASAPNFAARGQVVFDGLRQVALASQPAVRAQLDVLGAKYRAYWIVNLLAVAGNRAVVDALAARSDVLAIEPDRVFQVPLEPIKPDRSLETRQVSMGIEWNISKIGAPALWAMGYTGQNLVYANADTGVQWNHPALLAHYRGWNNSTVDHNYNWWDAIRSPIVGGNSCGYAVSVPCDDYGHGTHTMGTGIGDDGAGNQIGVAPGAKWIACRNMDYGYGRPSTYIECMQFFLAPTDLNGNNPDSNKRPDAVGNSYACPPSEGCMVNSLLAAMDNLRAAGVFMSVSAGNSGSSCSTVSDPPAIYDSAITVGATGSDDSIASFSSRGPVTVDGSNRRKPELVAPGVSVNSSVPGGGYGTNSGTSMAAPHVAGATLLLWSAFPALRRNVDYTEWLFEQSAVRLTTNQGCGGDTSTQVPNNVYGYGRIDVQRAYVYYFQLIAPYHFYFPFAVR